MAETFTKIVTIVFPMNNVIFSSLVYIVICVHAVA